ncbi:MAG: D-alanyl-D-alanine carboxypeptidase, partial [Deltaproteobacteria bacterium]|nr:D-alanyl-D-alanine carboxypeptidase [Deltaproteobacteria bacterium]
NDPPAPIYQKIVLMENEEANILLEAVDPEEDKIRFKLNRKPRHGNLFGIPPNLEYIPFKRFYGDDSLEFLVEDDQGMGKIGRIEFKVKRSKLDLANKKLEFSIVQNNRLKIPLDNMKDLKGTPEVVQEPKHGRVYFKGNNLIYFPEKGFTGIDSLVLLNEHGTFNEKEIPVTVRVFLTRKEENLSNQLAKLFKNGGVALGHPAEPDELYHDGIYPPASIIKIATAAAALNVLGPDYRFLTKIYLDEMDNLYLQGLGDPSLNMSDWEEIAHELKRQGVFDRRLNHLILDDSAFEEMVDFDGRRPSLNYFEAPLGALSTNENIIVVEIESKTEVTSRLKKTPITPMVLKRIKGLPLGVQKFSVPLSATESSIYTGELVLKAFGKYGGKFEGTMKRETVPDGLNPVLTHQSQKDLTEVVRSMLKQSSNFIANQIMAVMALEKYGKPATVQAGVEIMRRFLIHKLGLNDSELVLREGSGLSKENRVGLLAMLKILKYFEPYRDLLPSLADSRYFRLARLGRQWSIRAKSGSLRDVHNLAGYLEIKKDHWKPFVIMLNQKQRSGRSKVLESIGNYYIPKQ